MTTMEDNAPTFEPGFVYPAWDCVIAPEQQAEKLALCGLDPSWPGERVDLTLLAYAVLTSVRKAGISINGRVHMSQHFDMREPLMLGETLHVTGAVAAVTPARRGRIEESRFDFARPDGSVPLSTRRRSLVLDPSVGAARKPATAKPSAQTDPRDGMIRLARHQLVPENVAAYSEDAENLIHSDPATAKHFGFRAPIAAGLMAVHYLMAALARPTFPDRLRMTVNFRRPMFWDDALEIWGRHAPGDNDRIAALTVVNPEGKAAVECVIEEIGYGIAD